MSDTPRTDAAIYSTGIIGLCRTLEQELKASQAEVERLQNGFQGSCYCCEPVGILNQKLEAEVERLKAEVERLKAEVERLKAILRTYRIPS